MKGKLIEKIKDYVNGYVLNLNKDEVNYLLQALSQSEGETNIIDKNITFKFKDEHNTAEITLSVKDIWDNIREYVYEKLEDGLSNCNCMNESTNHCECSPVFDAFELDSINFTTPN